jgi:hypothetical protein
MSDLRARLADGHMSYLSAVDVLDFDADYAMLIKIFGSELNGSGRYSPPV